MSSINTPRKSLFSVWDPKTVVDTTLPDITRVIAEFDAENYDILTTALRQQVVRDASSGIAHVLLSEPGDSKQMAIMHFNPFGNALTNKMLLRAELCRRVCRASGIKDSEGKFLPILTCSSPHMRSSIRIKRHHRKTISQGSFEPAAQHYLSLAKHLGFKQLDFIGFSQGASLAASTAATAVKAGWPVKRLVVGDPVNVMARSRLQVAKLFLDEYPMLKQVFESRGLNSVKTAHAEEKMLKTFLGILRRGRTNYALFGGLTQNCFEADVSILQAAGVAITIGHGSHSRLSPLAVLKPLVEVLNAATIAPVELITINDSSHSWGERIDLLALFYAHGLSR